MKWAGQFATDWRHLVAGFRAMAPRLRRALCGLGLFWVLYTAFVVMIGPPWAVWIVACGWFMAGMTVADLVFHGRELARHKKIMQALDDQLNGLMVRVIGIGDAPDDRETRH